MYRGRRDVHLTMRVPQKNCRLVLIGMEKFVEVVIPDINGCITKPAKGILVDESQVYFIPNTEDNMIEELNANTVIRTCVHDRINSNKKGLAVEVMAVPGSWEELPINEIMRRYEIYYDKRRKAGK